MRSRKGMKFNESLLKSKIKENLKGIKNNLDREGKATAIAEALNFFDSKRDWVTKINRDEIISLITNSPSQDVLCESIIEKVNATPFTKSLKESKKKKESKKLNEGLNKKPLREGPGAGYTVRGAISSLSDIKVIDVKEGKNDYEDDIVTVSATANCRIHDVSASSYYYGRAIVGGAEIPATFEINFTYYASDFNGESPEQVVKYYNDFVFECGIGGGWTHVTFDGVIEGDYNDVKDDPYGCDTNTFKIVITNENVIKDIDNAVTGDDWYDSFDVIDIDGDIVDSFDNQDDAIAYAKKNRYVAVEHRQYQGALMSDFESEDILDEYNEGTVWERDYEKQYKFDDDDTNEGLKESRDDIQTKATKMMSVKKYYIDMAWKNGKTWKTDPMTLDEISKSVGAKVSEKQFVDMMSDNIKHRKDAKNLTKAEIVKLYDYMNGKWQGKDVLWSLKGKTNESLEQYHYARVLKKLAGRTITEHDLDACAKELGMDGYRLWNVLKALVDDMYITNGEKYGEEYFKIPENAYDELPSELKESKKNLKEGYYDYMDKDYADILDKDVDVYDIKQFVLNDTDNKFRTHYSDEYAIITAPNGKGCVVDYEAVGQDFDTLDSEIEFGIEENKDNEYTDENGKTHKTIRIFASHILTTTPKEVMEKAPKKTMKYRDFFRKYKYNDRCAKNFEELVSYIKKNGGLQENLKESYSIEQLASGETIDDYKDNCKKYNIKITQLDGDNIKLEGRKEDLINYYKEVVGVSEDMVDLKESCHSKKKRTLKEGYLGQTLEDFFYDCVDPEVIETVSLWGDDDEIYNGDYDGAMDEYGSNEFIEFDCGMDKVVINVDTSEEYQVTDYFIDVQDFVDCFNGDDIEVYDINTGETLFSGDRSELPDDVAEKIFVSFDAPKFISINVEEEYVSDWNDDVDENLEESKNNIPEKANLKKVLDRFDSNGKFAKQGNWKIARGGYDLAFQLYYDNIAVLDGINDGFSRETRLELDQDTYGANDEYNVKDLANYVCQVYNDCKVDENLKEDTVKQDGKWVNKGNTGKTHGEFKTKKEADKQRKAMFVNKKPNAKWGK